MKVYYRKRKRGITSQIDHIPKFFQLPRTASTSKPRTEFDLPICSFKDTELDQCSSKDIQSGVTVGCSDDTIKCLFSSRSTGPQYRRRKTPTNGLQLTVTDVKLLGQIPHVEPCSYSNNENRANASELAPNRSQLSEVCTTPGSIVWAKLDGKLWWPAQILRETSNPDWSVSVRYFGKDGSLWVDPELDLSPFEECFEERRSNQAKDFQNALKQALNFKEHPRSCKDSFGFPEGDDGVNHHDQLQDIKMTSGSSTPSSTSISSDPARKYGVQDPTNRNNISCNFCGKVVKGGVFRLKQHFVGGFRNVTVCLKCPKHVREEIKAYMQKKEMAKVENVINSRIRVVEYGLDDNEEDCSDVGGCKLPQREKPKVRGPMDINIKGERQQTINEVCNKELRDKACRDIAKWFYDAGISFNAATYDSFNTMLETVGQFGPGMKPPSMYELRVPLLNMEVKDVDNQVNEHKKEWAHKGCSILCDGCHDLVVQKDIINFMVNSPKGSVFIKSIDVSTVSNDTSVLFKILDTMVQEVGEGNVIQVVTDSAYVKAGKMLEDIRKRLYWTPCAAHCLDLMLEDIGKQIPRVKICLKNAMFANGYIHNFIGLVNLMRKYTNQKNLYRPAITRFATSFMTLLQFHKQKNNLRKMIISQEWVDSKWSRDPNGKKIESIFLQESFWRNIVYSLKLTGPLISLLRLVVDEKKPAMGYIYMAMDRAKETIEMSFNKKKESYDKTFDIIDNRWKCQLHQPLHAAGHYLNPSIFYDNAKRILEDEEIMGGLYSSIERLSPSVEDEDDIIGELSKYQNAEGLFGRNAAIRQRKQKSPVEWWALFGYSAPKLQQFAIRVLNLTCSATSREKNQDFFQHLHTKKRYKLAQETLNDVAYVKFNRALERQHGNDGTADPILLQVIDENNEWLTGRMEDDVEDAPVLIGDDLTCGSVGRSSKARASDDGSGPSINDKGKHYVEDEIEEDIGVSDDEGDEIVLNFDDED